MDTQRTVTILLPDDVDLRATLMAFCTAQNAMSDTAFNGGKPLRAVELQRAVYEQMKGTLSSQMTITARASSRARMLRPRATMPGASGQKPGARRALRACLGKG